MAIDPVMQHTDCKMRIDEMRMLRKSRSDVLSTALAQLLSIEELMRKLQSGERQDASYEDLANMMMSVRETLIDRR